MINIGKYVNTHGIKGEIKLISNFSRKDLAFQKDNKIYIDNKEFIIDSYRIHKKFDMLKLKDINNINDIEYLKNKEVYITSIDTEYLIEDFSNYKVVYNNIEYEILEIIENKLYKIIKTDNKLIPINENFIDKIDSENKKIYVKYMEGL